MCAQTREHGCTQVHVYMCTWCLRVMLYSGDSAEGVCPRVCSLSSLYKEPVCSPWWHLTQCLSSSPVSRALCPATRPVNTHALTHTQCTLDNHTCTSPALPQPDYDTLMSTHTHMHNTNTLGKLISC